MDGFIRGGTGEVALSAILPPQLAAFSTQAKRAAFADKYEAEHPGVIVLRDWEDPAAAETPEEREQRIKLRAQRRKERKIDNVRQPTSGMDPERAERELKRQYAFLAGLELNHPEYKKLFTNTVREIHALERDCGLPPSKFTEGTPFQKSGDVVAPETQEKLNKFAQLTKARKIANVKQTEDKAILRLIRDTEEDADVQAEATMRLKLLEALG